MFALIEITDGSPPHMICKETDIGGVSVYMTANIALFHAEPENTSPEEWVVIDEHGTLFSVVPVGKWFDLKPIKSDPVLAMQLMMQFLLGSERQNLRTAFKEGAKTAPTWFAKVAGLISKKWR